MAINCFAMPLAGLPTLRIRLNCASVASGMSEKSICESGICLTFLPARLSCADDPNRFFFMFPPPYRIHHEENSPCHRLSDALATGFVRRVFRIVPVQPIGISKDSRRLLKRDAMLFKVGNRLRDVPCEHVRVYTLMCPPIARTEGADGLSGLWGRGREERDERDWREAGLSGLSRFFRPSNQMNQRN